MAEFWHMSPAQMMHGRGISCMAPFYYQTSRAVLLLKEGGAQPYWQHCLQLSSTGWSHADQLDSLSMHPTSDGFNEIPQAQKAGLT